MRFLIRKDQFCFKHIRDLCGQAQITTGMLSIPKPTMGSGSLPNRASLLGETGYASSSQCQIGSRPAPRRPSARHPSAPGRSTQPSSKVATSRRALQLSQVVADPQTSKLHRTALRRNPRTSGGARRDRTDDLMLAKHALSQLSYGPSLFEERTSHKLGRASRLARMRPVRCLTTECGGPGRTRTSDLTLIKRAL